MCLLRYVRVFWLLVDAFGVLETERVTYEMLVNINRTFGGVHIPAELSHAVKDGSHGLNQIIHE